MWGTERTEPMASYAHSTGRPPRSARLLTCVVLAALGCVVPAPTEASTPLPRVTLTATVRQLGTLGGARSTAVDMDGSVVVGTSTTRSGAEHAFAYDLSTSRMRDLGTLGGATSQAAAVDGTVVVGSSRTAAGERHAFAIDLAAGAAASMRDLGTLGGATSEAVDVDNDVVAGSSTTQGLGLHAFAYDLRSPSPTMRDLGALRAFDFTSAEAIDGSVVVGTAGNSASGDEHAFAYDLASGSGMRDLGTLGFDFSQGLDVDGQHVVGNSFTSRYRHGDLGKHAFAYDLAAGRMRDLGDLGYDWSRAALVAGHVAVGVSRRAYGGPLHVFASDLGVRFPLARDLGNLGGQFIVPRAMAGRLLVGRAARAGDEQPRAFAYDFGASRPVLTDLGPLGGPAGDVVAVRGGTVAGTVVNAAGSPRAAVWSLRRTSAPALRFSGLRYLVREDGRHAVVTVRRAGSAASAVSVRYRATGVDATAGSDFTARAGTLRFAAGQTRATFSVPVRDDAAGERPETVLLTLRSPSGGAVLGTPNAAALVIRASDQRPDAWVSRQPSAGYVGDNVFNATGAGQTSALTARRAQTRSFYVRIYNDGNATDTMTVRGSRSRAGASVRYVTGPTDSTSWTRDVTRAMRSAGGWRVTLAPHRYQRIRVQVTVRRGAAVGSRQPAAVTATWQGDVTRTDRVRGVVTTAR